MQFLDRYKSSQLGLQEGLATGEYLETVHEPHKETDRVNCDPLSPHPSGPKRVPRKCASWFALLFLSRSELSW
jgi:hypothetical protein